MKGSAPYFVRELLDAFQQRELCKLRCRYFLLVRSLVRSLGVASGLRWSPQIAPDPTHPAEHSHMLAEPIARKNLPPS